MAFTIAIEERKIEYLDEDKNILNGLERENIESQFHCRDGFCGACRCTLIEGTVDYQQYPLACINENEILTCCAYPTSNIIIKIDA